MKNIEKIGDASEDMTISEMEVLAPMIPSKERTDCLAKTDENGLSKSSEPTKVEDIGIIDEDNVKAHLDVNLDGAVSDLNGQTDSEEVINQDKPINGIGTESNVQNKVDQLKVEEHSDVQNVGTEVVKDDFMSLEKPTVNSSPIHSSGDTPLKDASDEPFKMPNTIEELLDEEVLKDDPETPDVELHEQDSKESDCIVNNTEISNGHLEHREKSLSEDVKESVDTSKVDSQNPEVASREHDQGSESVKEDVGSEIAEKSPMDGMDESVKNAHIVQEPISKRDPESNSHISLEEVDQGSEDNSDDELDINAGLDKCFSALEKEISKDECQEVPDSNASTSEDNIRHEESKINDKPMEIDDSSRDVSNVPSEAEEGGNEADDEEDRERMVDPPEPVDLDQALGELEMIEKTTKRILDDESDSLKRPIDETQESSNKKAKIDESLDESGEVEVTKSKKLKKELKRMTRNDLEDLIANKMVEVMTNKSEIGKLRHQCDSFQESVEKWKRRAQALSKQCTDLSTVMRKYITDSKNRPKDKVAPVRITRSVGLQVMTPDQRRLQQQRQNLNRMNRDKAVAPGAIQHQQKVLHSKSVTSNGSSKQENGSSSTPSPALPRTVGGTTISPAKATTPVRNTGAVTITPTKAQASTAPKPVIDIVDLSDDESSTPAPQPAKPASQPVRNSAVRASTPRQQGQYVMQGSQMYPVRQVVPRQSLQASRPIMGTRPRAQMRSVHPAPLPPMPNPQPNSPNWKLLPPRPALKISRVNNGIVLSWNMNLNLATHATITSYQLYAYQESAMQRPDSSLWKKVGDVKALPLPMACTLTQFTRGNKYHFAVRAMDGHSRVGQFSEPNSIVLN